MEMQISELDFQLIQSNQHIHELSIENQQLREDLQSFRGGAGGMGTTNLLNKKSCDVLQEFDNLCELNNNDELDRQSFCGIFDEDKEIDLNANLNGGKDSIFFFPVTSPGQNNNTSFTKCYEVTDRQNYEG